MIRWLGMLVLLLMASEARADQLRPAYLELTQQSDADWRLVWKIPIVGGMAPTWQPVLPRHCTQTASPKRTLTATASITTGAIRCRGGLEGAAIGVSDIGSAQTDILVRVAPLNRPVQTLRLTAAEPFAPIAATPDRWQVAKTYFVIGIDHIVFGFDHLLFVIAMVLLLERGRAIIWAVTAFTLAHSITLVGTTLGLIGLPSRPVEAVIALSIVFLAVEIVKKVPGRPRLSERVPWAVAFTFGLLHGFGFAGALAEIGLPETEVPAALLSFNLGVEAGQLAIVGLTMLALALFARLSVRAMPHTMRFASYAIGITASAWLFERLIL